MSTDLDSVGMTKTTFTTEEVADLLSIDVQTVRRWCRDGDLPAAKLGRHYRVSRSDLERFYEERGGGSLFGDESDG